MTKDLKIYNSLTKEKEIFVPERKDLVGMYVCGPTVYNQVHVGNCRTFVFFDVVYRYFLSLGYKVRYVRNITDVGHLEDVSLTDKINKRAQIEKLEPMEVAHKYTLMFRDTMQQLNTLPPTLEPVASGHILEQIELIKQLIAKRYAYEADGSVYFDLEKYAENFDYGVLNNRKLEELLNNTRTLSGQEEKRGKLDFALWVKAKPEHIMKWHSPWSLGFPGWHIECSAMARKYLGEVFDLHGGGIDLKATHHSNEIAQTQAAIGKSPARVWMHANMLTLNGTKMSKSLNNSILPGQIFSGENEHFPKRYSPMTLKLLFLQAHYRSQMDISHKALEAAEKAYNKLRETANKFATVNCSAQSSFCIREISDKAYSAINDDFNTPVALSVMFKVCHKINLIERGEASLSAEDLKALQRLFLHFCNDILGLEIRSGESGLAEDLMKIINSIRQEAKKAKNWKTSDYIREELTNLGIVIHDNKDGSSSWKL